jgi:hypothetical protein
VASPTADSVWLPARRRARSRWIGIACAVGLLHVVLLGLLQRALSVAPARPAVAQAPLVLVWLKPELPTLPPAPAPVPAAAPQRQAPPRAPRIAPPVTPPAGVEPVRPEAATEAASGPTATPGAPAGHLLDSEATRRAIREAARQSSTSELAARATGEPASMSPQDKMGQEIARGARGDCLKGEYAGSGMGLFSLPFWLMAELREKCRR